MANIKAITLCNTKKHGKAGAEVEVSAAELAKLPHIYRAASEVAAEKAAIEIEPTLSAGDRHRAQKEEIRRQRDAVDQQMAQLRKERAEHDLRVAEEGKIAAEKAAEVTKQAEELARLRAENERLKAAQERKERAEADIRELHPVPKPIEPQPVPPPPAPPAEDVPPHKRKKDVG